MSQSFKCKNCGALLTGHSACACQFFAYPDYTHGWWIEPPSPIQEHKDEILHLLRDIAFNGWFDLDSTPKLDLALRANALLLKIEA